MKAVPYERTVYYYETDRMGCVHHSNYIRWFEEARVHLMETLGFPYTDMAANGIESPVLHVDVDYRTMARFGETALVETVMESYTGIRCAFSYTVRDKATGAVRCTGRTAHCFVNGEGRPVALQRAAPAYHETVEQALAMEREETDGDV